MGKRGAYIGINAEVPIYETQTKTYNVEGNLSTFFTCNNSGFNSFTWKNSYYTSPGATFTTTLNMVALTDLSISFDYSYSADTYDGIRVRVNGKTVVSKGGS